MDIINVNEELKSVIFSLGNLKYLSVQFDPDIKQINLVPPFLHLQKLLLTNISETAGEALQSLVEKNKNLTTLYLNYCSLNSRDLTSAILSNPIQVQLQFQYAQLTNEDLLKILDSSHSLTDLYIFYCNGINQNGINVAKDKYSKVEITYILNPQQEEPNTQLLRA